MFKLLRFIYACVKLWMFKSFFSKPVAWSSNCKFTEKLFSHLKHTQLVFRKQCSVIHNNNNSSSPKIKTNLKMANLKDDLDSYMLLGQERKSTSYKLNMKMPKLPAMLGGTSEGSSSNSWLQDDDSGWCPKMSRIQRMIACVTCLGLGIFCMVVSTFYIPVLVFKARKFSLLFSMGSLLLIAG